MKTLKISFILLFISLSFTLSAQDSAYYKVMEKALKMMQENNGLEEKQKTANLFDRISEKESNEWLPLYYSGLTYVYLSFSDSLDLNQRDNYLAKAKERANKAAELSENNVEITVLLGYIDMARLSADPGSRGQALSPLVMQNFGKALDMDPTNPRALAMMARMEMGMAQFFGSGTEKACGLATLSLSSYAKETDTGIQPSWGNGIAQQLVNSCEKQNKQ